MRSAAAQAATSPEGAPPAAARSLLRMAVGDDVVAVPIDDVREILQVTRMTPLPRTPAFVRGVMNLRGAVVPVIDLAVRLGLAPIEISRRACVVVVECAPPPDGERAGATGALVLGLLVDAVFEVFDCAAGEIEPAPVIGTRFAAEYLQGVTRARGALIGVLELDRLLAPQELSEAIAAYQPH